MQFSRLFYRIPGAQRINLRLAGERQVSPIDQKITISKCRGHPNQPVGFQIANSLRLLAKIQAREEGFNVAASGRLGLDTGARLNNRLRNRIPTRAQYLIGVR